MASEGVAERVREVVDAFYRAESRRVFATLIRLRSDFDLAEEALHDAFSAALERWPRDGVPGNPRAWLVSTGRFRAIDGLPRRARLGPLDGADGLVEPLTEDAAALDEAPDEESVEDDRLRLVFTCCHPALFPDAQIALTLREICGLTTEEIAHAFPTPVPTLAQRIVRAKSNSPTRPGANCAGGWGAPRRPALPSSEHSTSRVRSPRGDFSSAGCTSCRTDAGGGGR